MELSLVNCNLLKKIKSISQHQIAFPINTLKFVFMIMLLHYMQLCLVWKEHPTGQPWDILQWPVFLFRTFPLLPCFLLKYFPVSDPLPLVGKLRWVLFAVSWGFFPLDLTCLFLCAEGKPSVFQQLLPQSTWGQHSTRLLLATALLH